jgi:hypothetical protein
MTKEQIQSIQIGDTIIMDKPYGTSKWVVYGLVSQLHNRFYKVYSAVEKTRVGFFDYERLLDIDISLIKTENEEML